MQRLAHCSRAGPHALTSIIFVRLAVPGITRMRIRGLPVCTLGRRTKYPSPEAGEAVRGVGVRVVWTTAALALPGMLAFGYACAQSDAWASAADRRGSMEEMVLSGGAISMPKMTTLRISSRPGCRVSWRPGRTFTSIPRSPGPSEAWSAGCSEVPGSVTDRQTVLVALVNLDGHVHDPEPAGYQGLVVLRRLRVAGHQRNDHRVQVGAHRPQV